METAPASGSKWREPFAYFDRASSSWRTSRRSLLEGSGESCTTWPKQGTWDLGAAYELPTSERLTAASGSSSSRGLPTPTSRDWKGRNQRDDDSCLPGAVGKLLPTPGANDSTGAEKETREARQERKTGGPSLRDLPKLLPTPVVTDSFGSRRSTARTEEWKSNPGTTLTDAIWETQGRTTDTTGKLLPTPAARDGENSSEQGFRHYAGQGDNPTLLGAARRATGELRHSEDPSSGAPTSPPSGDGKPSSDELHPGQLTIEDALIPASQSGCSDSLTDGLRSMA